MDIFAGWEGYMDRLKNKWTETVKPGDTVVIAGDVAWASNIRENIAEFRFISELPGNKILLKGNHDHWWKNSGKMHIIFSEFSVKCIDFLRNNCFEFEDYGICGATGVDLELYCQNELVNRRNIIRIETSLKEATEKSLKPILFLHFPPIICNETRHIQKSDEILELIIKYNVTDVYYGHMHGENNHKVFKGKYEIKGKTINFHFIAADFVQFMPVLVV
jgi:predicted phosphohydrolase